MGVEIPYFGLVYPCSDHHFGFLRLERMASTRLKNLEIYNLGQNFLINITLTRSLITKAMINERPATVRAAREVMGKTPGNPQMEIRNTST